MRLPWTLVGVTCALVALILALAGSNPSAHADGELPSGEALDGSGHGVKAKAPLLEGIVDEGRLTRLYKNVVCSCPNENWSKTLYACPDGCAIPQKLQIQEAMKAGLTDAEIIEDQVRRHGPKAQADPGMSGAGAGAYFLPIIALFIFSWIAGGAVRRWAVDGRTARDERRKGHSVVTDEDRARIERDLESLE